VTIGADELHLGARLECAPHGSVTARLQFCHLIARQVYAGSLTRHDPVDRLSYHVGVVS